MPLNDRLRKSKLPPEELAVAGRLRMKREELRFTLEELAKEAGITKSALQHYEYGAAPLPFTAGDAICRRLGLNQDWLATGAASADRWLDLSRFESGPSALQKAQKMTLWEACTGPLRSQFAEWREIQPDRMEGGNAPPPQLSEIMKRMSILQIEMLIAEFAYVLEKSENLELKQGAIAILRDAIAELEQKLFRQNPIDDHTLVEDISQMEIAQRIKSIRARLGLSQKQAAGKWSVPVRTLQQWEQARSKPRGLGLVQLKAILQSEEKPTG